MTSVGVDGTAAAWRSPARSPGAIATSRFIKRDDGRLTERYIEPAYPHTPAGPPSRSSRRERQVASALRNCTDFTIASLIRGTDGTTGRAGGDGRPKRSR
jgi:hypothetical protein